MSDKAVIAGTAPIGIDVEAGKDYWWCACGRSKNQPFCDGSHKLTKGETAGKLHWYDEGGKRHEAKDAYPEIRSDE